MSTGNAALVTCLMIYLLVEWRSAKVLRQPSVESKQAFDAMLVDWDAWFRISRGWLVSRRLPAVNPAVLSPGWTNEVLDIFRWSALAARTPQRSECNASLRPGGDRMLYSDGAGETYASGMSARGAWPLSSANLQHDHQQRFLVLRSFRQLKILLLADIERKRLFVTRPS